MNKVLKSLLNILKLLGIALILLMVLLGILWYFLTADLREIDRKNKADPVYQKVMAELKEKEKAEKEIQKKLDKANKKKQAEEKAITDFEKSIHGKYTKEVLLRITSSDKEMAERLITVGGYDCMDYWYTSHNWDDEPCYDELSYYIFENKRCAKEAFNAMAESWIDNKTDSGKNYIQGWESGVLDAEVEVFIYQIDNMIITTELQVVSGWSEPESAEEGDSAVEFYYRKKFILDNF